MPLTRRALLISTIGLIGLGNSANAQTPKLVDSITAAGIGEYLLGGAISYVGGKILASALGEAQISDVKVWIAAAVQQIQAFVADELRRQLTDLVLDEMRADLEGVIQLMNQYAALKPESQQQNRNILNEVNTITALRIPRVSKYDQALPVLSAFVAYRLMARQALFILDRDPGHISSLRSEIDQFVLTNKGIRGRILPKLHVDARLAFKGCKQLPKSEGGPNQAECKFIVDGRTLLAETDLPRETADMIHANWKKVLENERQTFDSQSSGYMALATKCYSEMCKKIGEEFPIEGGTEKFNTTLLRLRTSGTIIVPGAVALPK